MIAEAFLCAAMALPPKGFTRPTLSISAFQVYRALTLATRKPKESVKILFIGDVPNWVETMRSVGLKAFGVAPVVSAPSAFYAVSSPFNLAIKKQTMQVTTYLLEDGQTVWDSSILLQAAIMTVAYNGYFVFNEVTWPKFIFLLQSLKWDKLPFSFQDMGIWKRSNKPGKGKLFTIREPWEASCT